MKKSISTRSLTIVLTFFVFLTLTFSVNAELPKTKIAVLDFGLTGDKTETPDMGKAFTELLITSLVKSGRFDVMEQSVLQKMIAKQKVATTGIMDTSNASQIGKVLGVNVIICGSIIDVQNSMEVTYRIINVQDSSILTADNIHSKGKDAHHNLVIQLTDKILDSFPLTGSVVKRVGSSAIIDIGKSSGLTEGTEFTAYLNGEEIRHPKTGEVLDVEQLNVGSLRITNVNKNTAQGQILREKGEGILDGTLVRSISKQPQEVGMSPDYKFGIFPWVMYREAESMTTVLTSILQYRIEDTPNLKLAKSYYLLKHIEPLHFDGDPAKLWNGDSPNVEMLQKIGAENEVNAAVLGKLNIVCRWSDNCNVRSFNVAVVDLESGKVYKESGPNWNLQAQDYIFEKVFQTFTAFSKDVGK